MKCVRAASGRLRYSMRKCRLIQSNGSKMDGICVGSSGCSEPAPDLPRLDFLFRNTRSTSESTANVDTRCTRHRYVPIPAEMNGQIHFSDHMLNTPVSGVSNRWLDFREHGRAICNREVLCTSATTTRKRLEETGAGRCAP